MVSVCDVAGAFLRVPPGAVISSSKLFPPAAFLLVDTVDTHALASPAVLTVNLLASEHGFCKMQHNKQSQITTNVNIPSNNDSTTYQRSNCGE